MDGNSKGQEVTQSFTEDARSFTERGAREEEKIDVASGILFWQAWYMPYFDFIYTNADIIRAAAYINARWDDQAMWGPPYASGYWGNTRIQAMKPFSSNGKMK